jgi:tRNA A-37 threonylcarbamoyl transferase component Bud32
MPTPRTECTELSVGFGILAVENLLELKQSQVEKYFEGTLSKEKYDRFREEFPNNEALYRQMYNVGLGLRAIYSPYKKVSSLKWAGPQQQAVTTAAAKDLIVVNTPVSVKENSDVVHNPSPYNLFETIPSGQVKAQSSENWYLEQAPQEYQELYSFVRSKGLDYLPEDVSEFEQSIKGRERKPIKYVIKQFSDGEKQAFKHLYLRMCHQVARVSADIFNNNYSASMLGRSSNAVLEQITRHFFRMNAVDYILGGIDKNNAFAVIVPELTRWKREWIITDVIAEPELDREQSRVQFLVHYKNRNSGITYTAEFHTQIRWSHGKFQNNPEAKLYKNFAWEEVAFFESIYGHESIIRLKIIGEGSYGIVYEAFHRRKVEKVAIKEFQSTIATTTEERGRFEREVKIMSKLRHPNILPIIDYDLSSRNCPWFAMPLAKTSIADIVDELKLNLQRVNNIYLQILTGMAYAHKQNIIHRDLKPQNILLFSDDRVMIGDFGLGKQLGADASVKDLTESDEHLGTFAYVSPEQLTSVASVDHRADIYALGKTLLHMVVGGDPPMFADRIIQQVDERYIAFIDRCIQEYPEHRFQSVDEMLENFSAITSEIEGN